MALEILKNVFMNEERPPNPFTVAMGELIRHARTEAGLSQLELANKIYRKQTTLSGMERGQIEVDAGTLAMIADTLRKPISYFFPGDMYKELKREELDPLETEVLLHFREIRGKNLQKLAIQLVTLVKDYDPKDLVIELQDYVLARLERDEEVKKLHEKTNKQK